MTAKAKSPSLSWSDEQYNELGIDDRILRAGYRNVTDRGIYITIPQGESVSVERIDGGNQLPTNLVQWPRKRFDHSRPSCDEHEGMEPRFFRHTTSIHLVD